MVVWLMSALPEAARNPPLASPALLNPWPPKAIFWLALPPVRCRDPLLSIAPPWALPPAPPPVVMAPPPALLSRNVQSVRVMIDWLEIAPPEAFPPLPKVPPAAG